MIYAVSPLTFFMNMRKALKMYIACLSVITTLFTPTSVLFMVSTMTDAQSFLVSFFEGVGSANSTRGFAFKEDTDCPLYMRPEIALRFPTPLDIISPYYTYGDDGALDQMDPDSVSCMIIPRKPFFQATCNY